MFYTLCHGNRLPNIPDVPLFGGSARDVFRHVARRPAARAGSPAYKVAPAGAVLVIDGLFLHRDELAGVWDLSVFLDVPFEVTANRMATRDGTIADPQHASMRRYVEAQRLYFGECSPRERASVVIDNAVLDTPRLVRVP